ncbi:hypothetical protein G7077_09185 [Sphingomonas piscis]|uniref:Uncharacterized protein n=1 Tax=Sphingomonas piscis TaxID=2714943 RepID=A0A6G7YQM7_9SPHN|nr:hypothetical protein [Sphingomonas piscis]QIK79039.1 hypothetical protein G7077_09185 [Sphingomonas piscis]
MPLKTLTSFARKRLPKPKTKAGKAGMIAGGVVGGLLALDLIALAATAVIAATIGSR